TTDIWNECKRTHFLETRCRCDLNAFTVKREGLMFCGRRLWTQNIESDNSLITINADKRLDIHNGTSESGSPLVFGFGNTYPLRPFESDIFPGPKLTETYDPIVCVCVCVVSNSEDFGIELKIWKNVLYHRLFAWSLPASPPPHNKLSPAQILGVVMV
ncbi:hypothetical protein STEG23_015326, partial [Scotinomys teguina]